MRWKSLAAPRLYAPVGPWFNKTWKPCDFELVDQDRRIMTMVTSSKLAGSLLLVHFRQAARLASK